MNNPSPSSPDVRRFLDAPLLQQLADESDSHEVLWPLVSTAINAINTMLVIADVRHEEQPLLFANRHFLHFTGYRADEVVGRNCRFLQHQADGTPDRDQPEALDEVRAAIREGRFARVILRNYKKGGELFYNELYLSPIHDSEGEVRFFVGVQNDVTARIVAEEEARRTSEALSSFFDSAPMLLGIVEEHPSDDSERAFVHVRGNETMARFFDSGQGTLNGQTLTQLFAAEDDIDLWHSAFDETRREGHPVRFDCRLDDPSAAPAPVAWLERPALATDAINRYLKRGEQGARFLSVTVNYIGETDDGRDRFSYIAEDVTEERRIERVRQLLEAAVEHADEAIIITEPDIDPPGPRFIYVNPAFTDITGYTPQDVSGKTPRILQGASTERVVLDGLRAALERGEPFRGHTRNYRKDGTEFMNEWYIAPIRNDENHIIYWMSTQRDITAQYEAEQELRILNQRLEQRVQERTAELERSNAALESRTEDLERFTFTVSHDLRSPLVTIRGFTKLLPSYIDQGDDDKLADALQRIERSTRHMEQLIDALLHLSKVGQTPPDRRPVDVDVLVREVVDDMAERSELPGCTFRIDGTLPPVAADPSQLHQVFENLLSNAVKYGCEGLGAQIRIDARYTADEVLYRVRDFGPGIPRDQHEQIFGLFKRLSQRSEGHGIGLAIVRKIMRMHGGHVRVASRPGAGATFVIAFPTDALVTDAAAAADPVS